MGGKKKSSKQRKSKAAFFFYPLLSQFLIYLLALLKVTLLATRETWRWTASAPRTHERRAEAEILIRLRAVKSKLSDNIPPPRRVVPCGGSWWANNRCCARPKNSAARLDAQKVERREPAGVSITAGPALEKCDRGYICVGFRALRRGGWGCWGEGTGGPR